MFVRVAVRLPPGPVTVRPTVNDPADVYVFDGFCSELVVPSPKVHAYEVILPVELLVKATINGALPETGVAVNAAVGAATVVVAEAMAE